VDENMVEGTVNSIVFSNPENGYAVIKLDTLEGSVTAAGIIPGIREGERLILSGAWMVHQQYGEQFKVSSFELLLPSSSDEIFRYLASGAIKNIGPAKARDIVDKFGSESLSIIENDPDKLSVIKGISLRSARKIGDGYRRQAGLRRLIDFLGQYGVKPVVATRVYKDYGDEAIEALRDNPYIISGDYYGADFSEADAIALDLGFESDCPQRVSAALVFELMHNLSNGHTFIPKDKLSMATDTLIGAGNGAISDAIDALCECGDIVVEEISGVEACYLRDMFEAESYIAKRLTEMASSSSHKPSSAFSHEKKYSESISNEHNPVAVYSNGSTSLVRQVADIIYEIEQSENIVFAEKQRNALEISAAFDVMALTGGPGTGKTTTVLGILMLFDAMGLKSALCAPTGRAAKRLAETCMREAATIHRLLGARPSDGGAAEFEHDEDNPLNVDVVIVDESSMLDIMLMRSLLFAMKRGCRLIMVGDADQLPPVGPGSVFSDILRSGVVPTIALSEIFRQAANSGIVRCAHSVNNGIMPDLSGKYPDLFFMKRESEEKLAQTVAELYGERLPKNMGIDPSLIQVLSPTRKRAAGTLMLNDRLRETVNPPGAQKKEKHLGNNVFRVGDKVMQIRNNYDIIWKTLDGVFEGTGVFNGDVGVVVDIDYDRETLTVSIDDKLVTYLYEQLSELEPAFAMTVHKSQGSEYHAVILAMTSAAPPLLTRGVLYTAMTRAKSLLVIVGNAEVMEHMVGNDKRLRRYSGLRSRLLG